MDFELGAESSVSFFYAKEGGAFAIFWALSKLVNGGDKRRTHRGRAETSSVPYFDTVRRAHVPQAMHAHAWSNLFTSLLHTRGRR